MIAAIHGCMAVVTAGRRLSGLAVRDGAQRINLDALPAAQAVAGWRRPPELPVSSAEPAAAQELACLCGRLPLALRIAGRTGCQPPPFCPGRPGQ